MESELITIKNIDSYEKTYPEIKFYFGGNCGYRIYSIFITNIFKKEWRFCLLAGNQS